MSGKFQRRTKEEGVNVTLASYLTSVDRSVLELLSLRGYIKIEHFEDITEIDVKRCIKERSTRKPGDF